MRNSTEKLYMDEKNEKYEMDVKGTKNWNWGN